METEDKQGRGIRLKSKVYRLGGRHGRGYREHKGGQSEEKSVESNMSELWVKKKRKQKGKKVKKKRCENLKGNLKLFVHDLF